MIVHKTEKLYQDKIGVKYNWLNGDWIYVETGSELANKILEYYPNYELVFDENGNLIDVTNTSA